MRRVDLIRTIEEFGCVLVRHGVSTTGIEIQSQAFPNRCRDIGKSKKV